MATNRHPPIRSQIDSLATVTLALPIANKPDPPAPSHGLPTPSSLPAALPLQDERSVSASPEAARVGGEDDRMDRSPSDSAVEEDSVGRRGEMGVFPLNVDMEQQTSGQLIQVQGLADSSSPTSAVSTSTSAFSANIFNRPYRSRYDASPPRPIPPEVDSLHLEPSIITAGSEPSSASSVKRSFEEVTPSTGTTPPAESSPAMEDALSNVYTPFPGAARPLSSQHYRHSFEEQRASVTSRMRSLREEDASTLRRRSPMSSRAGSRERAAAAAAALEQAEPTSRLAVVDRTKRRRSSTLQQDGMFGDDVLPELDIDVEMREASTSSRAPTTFAPALGRYPARPFPIDPIITTLEGRDSVVRATSTAYRLAPAVSFPATASTSAFSASPPIASGSGSTLLRPRSARARPDPMRERQFDPLVTFWREEREQERVNERVDRRGREILQEAGERLQRAERSLRYGEVAVGYDAEEPEEEGFPAVPVSPPGRVDVEMVISPQEEDLPSLHLPSIRQLPPPGDRGPPRPPIIGVRIGEGWGPPTSPRTLRRASEPISPISSTSDNGTTSGSRALSFLTSLRSRRPRLSRNATGVPPPESPEIIVPLETRLGLLAGDADEREREESRRIERSVERDAWRTGLAAMRGMQGGGGGDTRATLPPPPRSRLPWAEARREAAALSGSSTASLWGSVDTAEGATPSGRPQVAPVPIPAFNTTSRRMRGPTERANARWRLGQEPVPSAGATTAAAAAAETPSWQERRATSGRSETVARGETTPWTRQDSPSPRRMGAPRLSLPTSLFHSMAEVSNASAGEEHEDIFRGLEEGVVPRQSIRIPRPRAQPPVAFRSRLPPHQQQQVNNPLFDDSESEDEVHTQEAEGAAAAAGGRGTPWARPMLPSGSVGRRGGEGAELVDEQEERQTRRGRMLGGEGWGSQRREPLFFHPTFAFEHAFPSTTTSRTTTDTPTASTNGFDVRRSAEGRSTAPLNTASEGFLHRRRVPPVAEPASDSNNPSTLAAERHAARSERLASLRRERNVMRALLGEVTGATVETVDVEQQQQPRSPGGTRRRGLSDFFRGIGGVGGRFVAAWDSEFEGFYRRDSAALDARNYVDDDDFDSSYDALLRLSERLGDVKPKGVPVDKVSELAVFKYAEWPMPDRTLDSHPVGIVASTSAVTMDEDSAPFARKGIEKEERCAVCLQDYEDDEDVMLGRCKHGFHADCFKAWLKEHGTCPVCRRDHTE